MANREHIQILRKGVAVWNQWRLRHASVLPELDGANLQGAKLSRVDLSWADLGNADLRNADLDGAQLAGANLAGANLSGANCTGADLFGANLRLAVLEQTNLAGASLDAAKLSQARLVAADLSEATLVEADLRWTFIYRAVLTGADFTRAYALGTTFGDVDLGVCRGLRTMTHLGPSIVGMDTLYRSRNKIPAAFLLGAGVPGALIDSAGELGEQSIALPSCFIGSSSKDRLFAERLHADLLVHGVRCWYAPEDMRIGDNLRVAIDESIRLHDKLLLVLSEHSLASAWVQQEVETALERERRHGKTVLVPIRLDDAVMEVEAGWPALIRNTRQIGDFRRWRDQTAYEEAIERLLQDLIS